MSKNSGMGRKRVDNRNSKGLGKCAPNSRGEQCGDGRGLGKGKFEGMTIEKGLNPFNTGLPTDKTLIPKTGDLIFLKRQANELEAELKRIQAKISELT